MNYPLLFGAMTIVCLWSIARLGVLVRKKATEEGTHDKDEYGVALSATLTLLGLLIGFSFSMAISRYDQRKNYEEEEANAIGTEYLRADLLPQAAGQKIQRLLVEYLDLRIQRYQTHASHDISDVARKTSQLQNEMWAEVKNCALTNPNPVMTIVVAGMNDVINRQGYTQAARLNRIPLTGWGLMVLIALFCNFLIGYGSRSCRALTLLIVPTAIAVSFLLIADIDSPQGGLIRVAPDNMITLSNSLK